LIGDRSSDSKKKQLRQFVKIIGSVVSTLLFIWLISKQDWQTTWTNLRQIPAWLWPLCLVLVVTGMVFNALRWFVLLKAQDVEMPFGAVVKTVFAGAFASNFLPSTIGGDAFRIISLLRYTPDQALSVASVLVDRAINVAATVTFLPFSWFTFGNQIFYLFGSSSNSYFVAGIIPFWDKLVGIVRKMFARFKDAFIKWGRKPKVLAKSFGISWVSIFVVYIAVWLLAVSLGIPVTLFQVIGVAAVVYVVTLLPVSFNGYGVREVIYTTLYMQLGATIEQATTLALVSRFFMLIETIPGALWLTQIMNFQKSDSAQ
jgi:glycosyltransferase 2 family protein